LAEALFPWAVASVDEDFYEENCEFEEDEREAIMRATDENNGYYRALVDRKVVYPYRTDSGEVDFYRLKLKLNKLGKAFLLLSDYASDTGVE
jgi:hypothetical protein